jgi:hypothetical protein
MASEEIEISRFFGKIIWLLYFDPGVKNSSIFEPCSKK